MDSGMQAMKKKTQIILYFENEYIYRNITKDKAVAWGSSYASKRVSEGPRVNLDDCRIVLSKAVDKVIKQEPVL